MNSVLWIMTFVALVAGSDSMVRGEFDYFASTSSEQANSPLVSFEGEVAEDRDLDYLEAAFSEASSLGDAAQQDDGCESKDCTCCCPPKWTAMADALYLKRNIASSRVLFTDNFAGGAPALSLDDLAFDFELGYRLGLTRRINECRSVEVSFFSLDSWTTGNAVAGAPFQFAMNNLYGVTFADLNSLSAEYGTELHSVEVNLRHKRRERITTLIGFRYVELDELFSLVDSFGFGGLDMFDTRTQNFLYGGQLGADIKVVDRERFEVNLLGKAGLYYVRAKEFSQYNFFGTSGSDATDDIAFLGELTISGTYQIRPCLALRAGYQMSWLDGVALASEQMDGTTLVAPPNVTVDTDGGVFYHGGFAGLELRR